EAHRAVRGALGAGPERFGMRLVHYSAQTNHIHLLCEAADRLSLSRGLQSLCVRIARALNHLWRRAGSVFDDRYHDRILRSPREVKIALAYVLHNACHHGIHVAGGLDPCSSAEWFDGWSSPMPARQPTASPLSRARTWLLSLGWRRHGLIARLTTR